MKKLSKTKKYQLEEEMHQVATLYKALSSPVQQNSFATLVVKGSEIKIASWTENHHNNDIRNYAERTPIPGELKLWIPALENAFKKKAWEDFVLKIQDDALAEFYDRHRISQESK